MNVGITGHQDRPGIDWGWVGSRVGELLVTCSPAKCFSSLAAGADQVFAEQVLLTNNLLVAVIPIAISRYESYFEPSSLQKFRNYLSHAKRVQLGSDQPDDEHSFLAAGFYIVDRCDMLVAVWDGKPARGVGGTADVVGRAISGKKRIFHINPATRECGDLVQ